MSKRAISIVTALSVASLLPFTVAPAHGVPSATPSLSPAVAGHGASPDDPADNRLHPLAASKSSLRQEAVADLASQDARLVGSGTNRAILMDDGTKVDYPVTQKAQLLSFLVEFGDAGPLQGAIPPPEPSDNSTYWKASFNRQHYLDMFFNGMPEQDGESFKKFYTEMSSGRFELDGDVSDWVQVDRPESFYGANTFNGQEDPERMADFINDTADAWYAAQGGDADAVDIKDYLKRFDVWDRYDADHDGNYNEPDGYIDHFQAIHAGAGEEAGADPSTIWSHRSGAAYWAESGPELPDCSACKPQGGVEIGNSGYYVLDYTTEPENGGLGVFAHEFGHDLGLPDYYDTNHGDNSTGFWTLMSTGSGLGHGDGSIGTTPGQMGATEKYYLGWYGARQPDGSYADLAVVDGLSEEAQTVALGPSYRATTRGAQAVLVTLPDGEQADGPFPGSADGAYLYSGPHDDTASLAKSPPVAIPAEGGGDPVLHAQVAYQIEPGFDYAFLQVSDDNGASWTTVPTNRSVDPLHEDPDNDPATDLGITGVSGAPATEDPWWSFSPAWVSLSADLSDYAGDTVRVRWRYDTDPRTHGSGLAVDNLTVGDLTTTFGSVAGWDLDDFTSVADNVYAVEYSRYYLAENRQYRGYDKTLETGPYSWDYENTAYNRVDQFPYQDGLLVWYANGLYGDNNSTLHPGAGAALPVDAGSDLQLWLDHDGVPTAWTDGRLQTYDATFDVDQTDPLELTREVKDSEDLETLTVPARQSVPVFEDADPDAYLDDLVSPYTLWYSTSVAGAGTEIQVVSSDESTGRMVVKIGKRFVAATSEATIDGDESFGGTLSATPPDWFQDDVTATVAWLRDGTPIESADGTEYEITAADVGHTISAEITGSKDDYQDTTVTTNGIAAVADPAPEPSTQPSVTGTTQVGQTLTAHAAEWPMDGTSTFMWSIGGQSRGVGPTYVVQPGDLGLAVTLTETFSSPGYEDATASAASAVITKGSAPQATAATSFTGTARVGQRLTAVKATWPVVGESTFAWTVGGTAVGTGATYAVAPADLGKPVAVTETFTSPGYDVATSAVASAAVIAGQAPVATKQARISGTIRMGSTLKAIPATWPVAGTSTFTWSVAGQAVGTGRSYAVRAADVGKPLRLTETLAVAGYDNGRSNTESEAVAKAPVTLSVTIGKAKKGKKVSVTVTPKSGRLKVSGKVTVTYAGKKIGSPTLKKGKGTVRLPAKPKGKYWLTISYAGTSVYAKAGKTVAVKVK
jgi:immune inhibitor A